MQRWTKGVQYSASVRELQPQGVLALHECQVRESILFIYAINGEQTDFRSQSRPETHLEDSSDEMISRCAIIIHLDLA